MARDYSLQRGAGNGRYKTGLASSAQVGIYNSWQNMKGRCLNPNHPKFDRYGGRGICIHTPWLDIRCFLKWALASGWRRGLQIDRINNDGPYSPENCRWVSAKENARRKSTTKLSEQDAAAIRHFVAYGFKHQHLADHFDVTNGTIWFIAKGMTHVQ